MGQMPGKRSLHLPKGVQPLSLQVAGGREVGRKGAEIRCPGLSPQLCFVIVQSSWSALREMFFQHMGCCPLARCLLLVAFGGLLRHLPWEGFPAAYAFFQLVRVPGTLLLKTYCVILTSGIWLHFPCPTSKKSPYLLLAIFKVFHVFISSSKTSLFLVLPHDFLSEGF